MRPQPKRTEHGPRWENANPGKGCNSTHVARARRGWARINARRRRRQLKRELEEEWPTEQPQQSSTD